MAITLPLISAEKLDKLQGRSWGHIGRPDASLPQWVRRIPDWAEEEVLALGPAFETAQKNEKLINTEKLLDASRPQSAVPSIKLDEGWYVLVCDEEARNALLIDAPFDRHEEWIDEIRRRKGPPFAFAVRKHPDQDQKQ